MCACTRGRGEEVHLYICMRKKNNWGKGNWRKKYIKTFKEKTVLILITWANLCLIWEDFWRLP